MACSICMASGLRRALGPSSTIDPIFGPTLKKTFHMHVCTNQAPGAEHDRQKLSRRYCIKAALEMV